MLDEPDIALRYRPGNRRPSRFRFRPYRRRSFRGSGGPNLRTMFSALVVTLLVGPPIVDVVNGTVKPTNGCRVLALVDGDTVKMWCPSDGWRSARLLGFDTPEVKAGCPSEFLKSAAAINVLRWQLWTARKISNVRRGQDRYGRDLTLLLVDGQNVGNRLVGLDLAVPYEGGRRIDWCKRLPR